MADGGFNQDKTGMQIHTARQQSQKTLGCPGHIQVQESHISVQNVDGSRVSKYSATYGNLEAGRPHTVCPRSRNCHCLETKRHSVLVPVFQPKLRRVNFYIRGQQLNYTHLNMNKTQDQSMIQRETSLNCFISNSSLHPHSPTRLVKTEIRRTHFPVLISSPVLIR